jgi:phosphoglycolate phosphatase-like HAD superfamily hydrolase
MIKHHRGILFDVDGTLSDSFALGFTSTQQVLLRNGYREITEEEYHQGTKYSTPRRFAWHLTSNPDDPIGHILGQQFDDLYVDLVSTETTALFPGIIPMLNTLLKSQHGETTIKIGALSNACGGYVKAVLDVNELKSFFDIGLGADEVFIYIYICLEILICYYIVSCLFVDDLLLSSGSITKTETRWTVANMSRVEYCPNRLCLCGRLSV